MTIRHSITARPIRPALVLAFTCFCAVAGLAGALPCKALPATSLPPLPVAPPPSLAVPAPALAVPAPALAVPAPAPTAPPIVGKISSINVKGNIHVTSDAIKAVISQKVGDSYDQTAAEKDRDAIKGMGYFYGDVGLSATQSPGGGVDVTYTVVENPIVKKIVFTANTPDHQPVISPEKPKPGEKSASDKLKDKMDTHEGMVLNTNTLERDLDKLFNRQTGDLRKDGYIVDVSPDINIDPTNNVLTIPLIETHIESIQVKGNKKTKPVVIYRELHPKAGDVLNEKVLQKDLTKIYNLGLFDQVGPFDEIPTDVGKVIISIPVVEKRSGQVSVGVGYSSQSKLVGRAELAENNFRGLGERASIQWEVGGVSSASSLELGFVEPYLDRYHTSLSIDAFDKAVYRFSSSTFSNTVGTASTYTEQHRGAVISANRPTSDTTNVGVTVRSETVRTNDVAVPVEGTFIRQDGNVSALGFRASSNTKDNDISPAGGGLRSLSYELGRANTTTVNNAPTPLSPGAHPFGKFGGDFRQYISLQGPRKLGDFRSPKKVFAVHLQLGFTQKDIPFFEQYFLGGADSLRGYQEDRFWGSSMVLFQSELRIPVGKTSDYQAVLLADVGDAWGSIYQGQGLEQHNNMKLSSDFGVGVRLVTPIGPIRLDYAIGRDGGRTQFSIGQSF